MDKSNQVNKSSNNGNSGGNRNNNRNNNRYQRNNRDNNRDNNRYQRNNGGDGQRYNRNNRYQRNNNLRMRDITMDDYKIILDSEKYQRQLESSGYTGWASEVEYFIKQFMFDKNAETPEFVHTNMVSRYSEDCREYKRPSMYQGVCV